MMKMIGSDLKCTGGKVLAGIVIGLGVSSSALSFDDREVRTVESGAVNAVSVVPLSIVIDDRVYQIAPDATLGGQPLKGDDRELGLRLRALVGLNVGYDWYPGVQGAPVVLTLMPFDSVESGRVE